MKNLVKLIAGIGFFSSVFMGHAQEASNLDELLLQLKQGQISQNKQNIAREAEFTAKNQLKSNNYSKPMTGEIRPLS